MRITIIIAATLAVALALPATDAAAEDKIYRWVDKDGVVHFGDQPGAQGNPETITVETSRGVAPQASPAPTTGDNSLQQEPVPSAAQQQRDERAEKRREAAERKEAVAAGCEQRHKLVAQLEPSTRVIVEYEDGTVGRLDDNERLEVLAEAKTYIARNCED